MKIILSPKVEKILRKLPKIDQIALTRKIRLIPDIKSREQEERLKGFKNICRVRLGDYQIVYSRTAAEIYIIIIGHRKDIYDLLKHLFS